MGCDKARMLFCGDPLIERVLGRLAQVAGELVVTTSRPSELAYLEERAFGGLVPRVVADLEGSAGAMRGIASSLAAARLPLAAIVACDIPFVSPELIGAVMPFSGDALAAFRAATEGRITPADYHQLVL